jgi:hypothetical protein
MQIVELPPYWTEEEKRQAAEAATMSQLARVAFTILERMPRPIVEVCGPMSTGGVGTLEGNLARFRQAIVVLSRRGYNVFDQLPFQAEMLRIIQSRHVAKGSYCWEILEEFYRPIFTSGLIAQAFFLPDWRTSTGARWERSQAVLARIPMSQLLESWFSEEV